MDPKIQIPSPCSQNPGNFIRSEKGGFCKSCQKEVVDFRAMSGKEVIDFIRTSPTSKCGIFLKNQIEENVVNSGKMRFGVLWMISIMGLLGISSPAFSQTKLTSTLEQEHNIGHHNSPNPLPKAKNKIHGKIFSEEDKGALPGVIVLIKGTNVGTTSDRDGQFELEIPDSLGKKKVVLVFSFVGFNSIEKKVSLKENPMIIQIYLKESKYVLGPFGLINPKKSFWNHLVSYFKREILS